MHLPHRTVRVRLTALYGGLFLLSGATLLAIMNLLVTRQINDHLPSFGHPVVEYPGNRPPAGDPQVIAATHQQAATDLHQVLVVSAAGLAFSVIVAGVLGWVVAGRVLRPVHLMTAATQQISESNLHERLTEDGPADELTDLAVTINQLLARLEAAFDAQGQFIANAAHELRTPMAMIRTSVDVATAKPGPIPRELTVLAGKLRESLGQSDRLLEGLLMLARAQHGAKLSEQTTISLDETLADAINARTDAIASKVVRVERAGSGAWVCGDGMLMTQMVGNVIDNAVRHNESCGWIHTEVRTDGITARLIVENGGLILNPCIVQELVQPFRRLGGDRIGSRDGSGLGLSIVAAIVSEHGGSLRLEARSEGGLRVTIELPSAPSGVTAGARAEALP